MTQVGKKIHTSVRNPSITAITALIEMIYVIF
jgi:hypothetical protein